MLSLYEFDQLSSDQKMWYLVEISSHTTALSMAIIEELSQKVRFLNQENEALKEKYKNSIIIPTNYN